MSLLNSAHLSESTEKKLFRVEFPTYNYFYRY